MVCDARANERVARAVYRSASSRGVRTLAAQIDVAYVQLDGAPIAGSPDFLARCQAIIDKAKN